MHDEIRVISPNSSLLLEIRILLKYAFYLRKIVLGFLQCTRGGINVINRLITTGLYEKPTCPSSWMTSHFS
jgi:hypothetical protein